MKEQRPEIKELTFEYQEAEIVETFIDESGKTRERTKRVSLPTGKVIGQSESKNADQATGQE